MDAPPPKTKMAARNRNGEFFPSHMRPVALKGTLRCFSDNTPELTEGNFARKLPRFIWNRPVHRFDEKPAGSTGF